MDLKKIERVITRNLNKYSPEILIGLGITGFITTTILAVRATPKALKLMEEEKVETGKKTLPVTDVVKVTWKCYIPATISGVLSTGCIIGANYIQGRRSAALATAYSLSEAALKTYQQKVIETIGEKKEEEIRSEIDKDKLRADPVANKEVIITGKGETLCYDPISCRYFKADLQKLRRIEAQLNKELYSSMYVSLNDFYEFIGLRASDIGDDIGWNVDEGPVEFDFSAQLADDDTPCLVIDFRVKPRNDYRHLY